MSTLFLRERTRPVACPVRESPAALDVSQRRWDRRRRDAPFRTHKREARSMTMRYDVAIIGTGAGGGTLAYALASTGKKILILERGDYVPREQANWSTRAVNLEGRYQTKEVWRDADGAPLHPHTNYWVGGNTKFYGAALFRLRREDFGEIKHWGGVSPAWPISYEDLEPYYSQAEHRSEERRVGKDGRSRWAQYGQMTK